MDLCLSNERKKYIYIYQPHICEPYCLGYQKKIKGNQYKKVKADYKFFKSLDVNNITIYNSAKLLIILKFKTAVSVFLFIGLSN